MIKRFNDEKPIEGQGYDVFGKNGNYLGYFDYLELPTPGWYRDREDFPYDAEGSYYSDDNDDWLKMLDGEITKQDFYDKNRKRCNVYNLMNYLDEHKPQGKMCLSNMECEDLEHAFSSGDWEKVIRYIHKYE